MSDQTKIEWCDSTLNPWVGCTKVSPACDHCYAEAMMDTRLGRVEWGAGKPRQRTSASNWRKPVRWNQTPFWQCDECGWRGDDPSTQGTELTEGIESCPHCDSLRLSEARRRVFCASLADWLDNEVPIDWLVDLLDLIRQTPNLDWLLLTKRIGNFFGRMELAVDRLDMLHIEAEKPRKFIGWIDAWLAGRPPPNVWIGATVIDQTEANRDIPKLLATPASVRFVSIEPMLGAIDLNAMSRTIGAGLDEITAQDDDYGPPLGGICGIDWVICGGESGRDARPMHPRWVRSLRDQCTDTEVPFLFKQWGEWFPFGGIDADGYKNCVDRGERPGQWHPWDDDAVGSVRLGKAKAGRTLDGKTWTQFPEVAA